MITDEIELPGGFAGTRHHITVHRFGRLGARPRIYLQGALHADEIPGMACLVELRRLLLAREAAGQIRGEIVLVPVANPLGLAQQVLGQPVGRFDLSEGGNFNRDYPALGAALIERVAAQLDDDAARNVERVRDALGALIAEWPAAGLPEALKKALLREAFMADLVLDLHCDAEAAMHLYTQPAAMPAFAPLAARLGCQAVLLADVSGGDPFDEALSRPWLELAAAVPGKPVPLGCQSTTVELRGQADVSRPMAAADAAAILDFLHDAGAVAGEAAPVPAPLCAPTPLAASMPVLAPLGGILSYCRVPGETLAEGEVLAEIIDPVTGSITPVASPCAGVLFARTQIRHVQPGRRLGKVAGQVPTRSGPLLSP